MTPTQKNWCIGIAIVLLGCLALAQRKWWPVCLMFFCYQVVKVVKSFETGQINSWLFQRYRETTFDQDENPLLYIFAVAFEFVLALAFFLGMFLAL